MESAAPHLKKGADKEKEGKGLGGEDDMPCLAGDIDAAASAAIAVGPARGPVAPRLADPVPPTTSTSDPAADARGTPKMAGESSGAVGAHAPPPPPPARAPVERLATSEGSTLSGGSRDALELGISPEHGALPASDSACSAGPARPDAYLGLGRQSLAEGPPLLPSLDTDLVEALEGAKVSLSRGEPEVARAGLLAAQARWSQQLPRCAELSGLRALLARAHCVLGDFGAAASILRADVGAVAGTDVEGLSHEIAALEAAQAAKEEGNALFREGSYREALAIYSTSPCWQSSALLQGNAALAHARLGDHAMARAAAESALGLNRHHVKARRLLGRQ